MEYYPRLRDLREDRDLNQDEVAKVIGTDQSYYAKYEKGIRPISFERVIMLAKFYNVSIDYIAGLTNDKRGIGYTKQLDSTNKTLPNNDNNKYNITSSSSGSKYNITQSNRGGLNNISIKGK